MSLEDTHIFDTWLSQLCKMMPGIRQSLVIAMGHINGQKVVAEGVEDAYQLEFLKAYDCDVIQGFYFSTPLDEADFSSYLKNTKD